MIRMIKVNLLRRWGRTALTILGVAAGVTTVVALLAVTAGLSRSAGDLARLGRADFGVLTPPAQDKLIALVVTQGKGLITSRPSCSDAVGLVRAVAGAQLMQALAGARVEQVHVNGSTATAQVVDGAQFPPQDVTLEKSGGNWKISGVPSLGA
jgi:hypothetical protein